MTLPAPSGRVAPVTGARRGLGPAIARRLVADGYQGDAEHQRAAVEQTQRRFGRLDVQVNYSAVNPLFGPLAQADCGEARPSGALLRGEL